MSEAGSGLPSSGEVATTPDERTMAVLAHVLQLVGGWIAPLVIFFLKCQSRFISFHSLQVLLFEGVCMFFTMFVMGGFFLVMALSISLGRWNLEQNHAAPPALFFLFFGIFWLGFAALFVLRLVLAIVYGIKAGRGEWAEYPILGRLARRILRIGPGGSFVNP